MAKRTTLEKRFLKIIYFAEESAIDYINIYDGGLVIKSDESVDNSLVKTVVKLDVGIESKFSFFNLFIKRANVL